MTEHEVESGCVFCSILRRDTPAEIVDQWPEALAIVPLNPVVYGHVIVIPRFHAESAKTHPSTAGVVMECAARFARRYDSFNIITSAGAPATQTINHLHVHVVPRVEGDGLHLPWTEF